MDVTEAQERLQMVDRILARTDGDGCLSPYPLIVWGLAGVVMNVVVQLVYAKQAQRAVFGGGAILLASLVVANFMLRFAGYVFALGELVGMTGTGLALYATQR